jgi:hypothetical protein
VEAVNRHFSWGAHVRHYLALMDATADRVPSVRRAPRRSWTTPARPLISC